MKRSICYLGCIVLMIVVTGSCSKASEEELAPPCNTDNMSYSTNILPILRNNCYGCHGNGTVTADINLDGYTNLKVQVDNGNFVGAVTHAAGYTPMPYNLPKLSDCDINKIKAWIQRGAPNN